MFKLLPSKLSWKAFQQLCSRVSAVRSINNSRQKDTTKNLKKYLTHTTQTQTEAKAAHNKKQHTNKTYKTYNNRNTTQLQTQ